MGRFELSNSAALAAEKSFTANAGSHALAEVQGAAPITPQPHALLPQVTPGAGSGLAALAQANQPISPLIQMIMRMPGHLGLLSSFFEAMQNMILPHSDLLANIDLSSLTGHHPIDSTSLTEHPPIDLAAVPPGAHVFDRLHDAGMPGALHWGETQLHFHSEPAPGATDMSLKLSPDTKNVSGSIDLSKAIYEGGHGSQSVAMKQEGSADAVSGPGMIEVTPANHLAQARTVFSQNFLEGNSSRLNSFAGQSNTPPTVSQNAPLTSTPNSALNVSTPLTTTPSHSFSRLSDSLHPQTNIDTDYGPSGAVSETLGGKHLLAMSSASDVAPPSLTAGTPTQSIGLKDTGLAQPETALKAKELSFADLQKPPTANTQALPKIAGAEHGMRPAHHSGLDHKMRATESSNHAPALQPKLSTTTNNATHSVKSQAAVGSPATQNIQIQQEAASSNDTIATATGVNGSYTIHNGDCLWNIAKFNLGDATRWPEIYKLNLDKIGSHPDLIHSGTKLDLPGANGSIAAGSGEAHTYTVHSGDSLWKISSKLLGSGTRWGELYKLNSNMIGENPSLILPGQELHLPGPDNVPMVADAAGTAAPSQTLAMAPAQPAIGKEGIGDGGGDGASACTTNGMQAQLQTDALPALQAPTVTATVPHTPALAGSGSAEATPLAASQTGQTSSSANHNTIVSPSLAPDLSFLARKR
jgi:LysM repeat protein